MAKPSAKEQQATIKGQTWTIRFETHHTMPRDRWGEFNETKQVIRVRRDLSDTNFLDTLIHEITHILRPHEDEYYVDKMSTELAKALMSTGMVTIQK